MKVKIGKFAKDVEKFKNGLVYKNENSKIYIVKIPFNYFILITL